mmetsp:Transcript_15080/g.38002  ORF Transcript_15080/g.38002 Transcript_15080/m.38002 type:complete len:204 (+) Transcript_15080:282-893(+)
MKAIVVISWRNVKPGGHGSECGGRKGRDAAESHAKVLDCCKYFFGFVGIIDASFVVVGALEGPLDQFVVVNHIGSNHRAFLCIFFHCFFLVGACFVIQCKPNLVQVFRDVHASRPVAGHDNRVTGTKVVAGSVHVRQASKATQQIKELRLVACRNLAGPPALRARGRSARQECFLVERNLVGKASCRLYGFSHVGIFADGLNQ